MSVSTTGWALRINGTCGSNEVDCGATRAPYRACCPSGSSCPSQYNVACCPSTVNCTSALVQTPHCANESWDMYDNGGYFCCQRGTTGYASTTNSDGCAKAGYSFSSGETLLNIIIAGQDISSTTSSVVSSTSTAVSTTSAVAVSSPETQSSTNVGAIVGGVVGGLAGLGLIVVAAWMIVRRRRRQPNPGETATSETDGNNAYVLLEKPSELPEAGKPTELPGQHGASELPQGPLVVNSRAVELE